MNQNKLYYLALGKARILKRGISFLMILALGFTSCKKEFNDYGLFNEANKNNVKTPKLTIKNIEKYVANPLNPMDEIGRLHNAGFNDVLNSEYINSNYSSNILKKNLRDFSNKRKLEISLTDDQYISMTKENVKLSNSLNNNLNDYISSLLIRKLVNNRQYEYLKDFHDITVDLKQIVTSNNGNLLKSYIDLSIKIKDLELKLLNDNNFKQENDKLLIFSVTSIYRYSMFNYLDIISNRDHILHSIPSDGDTIFVNVDSTPSVIVANWTKVGQADALGAAWGIGVGGIGAAIYGPIALSAVLKLGFSGSVSSSFQELISQFISGEAYVLADWR